MMRTWCAPVFCNYKTAFLTDNWRGCYYWASFVESFDSRYFDCLTTERCGRGLCDWIYLYWSVQQQHWSVNRLEVSVADLRLGNAFVWRFVTEVHLRSVAVPSYSSAAYFKDDGHWSSSVWASSAMDSFTNGEPSWFFGLHWLWEH